MLADLRLAWRSLTRSPGYALVVIALLSLGIGTCAALYSSLRGSLFKAFDFPDKDRLVRIESIYQGNAYPTVTMLPRYLAFREQAKSFATMAGGVYDGLNLVVNGEPEGVNVSKVTANYFTVLGVPAYLGRTFVPNDEQPGADTVAVIRFGLWRSRFGSDPKIIGKDIQLNDRIYQVIGVLPESFRPPPNTLGGPLYLPYVMPPVATPQNASTSVSMIGRLRPGVNRAQAEAELRTILPEKGQPYAEFHAKFSAVVAAIDSVPDPTSNQRYQILQWVGIVAVAFLYLIACINAGSLMLVRALGRRREVGIRLALGAGRWQVARPLFAEAMLLSLAAILLGTLVAKWVLPALLAIAPGSEENFGNALTLHADTLALLACLGGLTGVLVASGPAWSAARLNVTEAMKDSSQGGGESRRMRRLRTGLVVVEATLAVTLLAGTGLMVRTFQRLQDYDPGFKGDGRYLVNTRISREERMTAKVRFDKHRMIAERLRAIPGVSGVALVSNFNPTYYGPQKVKLLGKPEAGEVEVAMTPVSPEFTEMAGIPLRAGRALSTLHEGDPIGVVVSESFARNYFPGRSPLGELIEPYAKAQWEIIGVVGDIRSARTEAKPRLYFPYWVQQGGGYGLVVRTMAPAGPKFNSDLRRAIYEVDPKFAVMNVYRIDQPLKWEIGTERFAMAVLEVLGTLALLLAVMGLFAMMAYTVAQRRTEFGVRLTFGATPDSIKWLVVRGGLLITALGVVIGLALAVGLARLMQAALYGSKGADWLVFGFVGLLMLLVALPACWWPARHAGQVDVVRLLRPE